MLIPRLVAFDSNDKAICAGVACHTAPTPFTIRVIELPSSHYDFIDFDVKGKTEEEIQQEIKINCGFGGHSGELKIPA